MHMNFTAVAVTAGLLALGSALPAHAQQTWNLGGSSCNPTLPVPKTASCAVGGVNATMSAWSNTGNSGTTFVQADINAYDPNGFGAKSGDNETGYNSHHAFDSSTGNTSSTRCGTSLSQKSSGCGGSIEMMLVQFDEAVLLSSVAIGYWTDADMSISRWDGGSTFDPNGKTAAGLTSAGWTLVSSKDVDNYGVDFHNPNTTGTGNNAKRFDINTGEGYTSASDGKYSSWWLISTYYGADNGYLQKGNDAFKVLNFAASQCAGTISNGNYGTCGPGGTPAPEPASLALVALALAGAGFARRGKKRSA